MPYDLRQYIRKTQTRAVIYVASAQKNVMSILPVIKRGLSIKLVDPRKLENPEKGRGCIREKDGEADLSLDRKTSKAQHRLRETGCLKKKRLQKSEGS